MMVSRANKGENSISISSNMAELISTLAFYERLIENSNILDDEFASLTQDQKKMKWQNIVSVSKKTDSGVLVIHAQGETSERSKMLAEETARTLFATAGLYYNIKTDIDMRVIDGPIVSYTLARPWLYGLTVLLSSIGLTVSFFFLLYTIPTIFSRREKKHTFPYFPEQHEKFEERENHFAYGVFDSEDVSFIDPKKFIPEKPDTLVFEKDTIEKIEQKAFPSLSEMKRSGAPINLPVASDESELIFADESSLPFTFESQEETIVQRLTPEDEVSSIESSVAGSEERSSIISGTAEEKEKEISTAEPTIEDYKRRLNELLSDTEK